MASSPSSSSPKVTLKLLIDTKNEKVLFAEASKAVIDFLFNMLCLPIGTVVKLLSKDGMVGSLGNLYHSVENLNDNYMQPDQINKDVLLNPRVPISSIEISGLLSQNHHDDHDDDIQRTKFYTCQRSSAGYTSICGSYDFTCDNTTRCSSCSQPMNCALRFVGTKVAKEGTSIKSGFVKDMVTFMVTDDLVIEPMSTISCITVLNNFNVKEIGTLQEKVVELGMDEGIKLLKASLQSKMVLTSVFIKKD